MYRGVSFITAEERTQTVVVLYDFQVFDEDAHRGLVAGDFGSALCTAPFLGKHRGAIVVGAVLFSRPVLHRFRRHQP